MSTDNAGLVTEEMVRKACDAHDAWMADKYGEGEAVAGAMHVALETALSAMWRSISEAPFEVPVWVFDPTQDPQQFVATLTEDFEGPFWRPAEELVADVMDDYLHPTHFMPLPPAPQQKEVA